MESVSSEIGFLIDSGKVIKLGNSSICSDRKEVRQLISRSDVRLGSHLKMESVSSEVSSGKVIKLGQFEMVSSFRVEIH